MTKILSYGQLLGRIPTPNTQNPSPNTQHPKTNTQNPIPNTQHPISFSFDLPFDEALKYFTNLNVTNPKDFYKQIKHDSGVAFTISKLTSQNTITAVRDAIAKNLKDKINPQKLKEEIAHIATSRGEKALSPFHLQTIVQTNLQTAFSKGNYLNLKKSSKEYWQYIAIDDQRTTPLCASLDMKVFNKDDPFWNTYFPPNHFNCRSTVVSLDQDELNDEKLEVFPQDVPHTPHTPGPGFTASPDKGLEKWLKSQCKTNNIKYSNNMNPPLNSEKEAIAYWHQNIMNISNNHFEIAAILDKNYNYIYDKTGKSNINFSLAELEKLQNANLIIHNHPNNTTFSNTDIKFMIEQNINSMIVLNKDKYTKIWNVKIDYKAYENEWNQFFIDNENLFNSLVIENNKDYKEAYDEIKRKFFKRLEKEKSIRMVQKTNGKG